METTLLSPKMSMIKQQIQPNNIKDAEVLEALLSLNREDFVPDRYRSFAYAEWNIPLSRGQTMLSPVLEAKMLQALKLSKHDTVLEVGSGTGYFSALLGRLSAQVLSVDLYREFSDIAALNTVSHGVNNIRFETGDASLFWRPFSDSVPRYDAIVLTGSLPVFPEKYIELLSENGRLVMVLGEAPAMKLICWTKKSYVQRNLGVKEELWNTCIPALKSVSQSLSVPLLQGGNFK